MSMGCVARGGRDLCGCMGCIGSRGIIFMSWKMVNMF